MEMIATTPIYEVTKIIKPTKAKLFQNLVVGSKIQISTTVGSLGSNRGHCYAPGLTVENMDTEEDIWLTFNEFGNRTNNFEFKLN
jgi:hypothetical protein